VFTVTGRKMTGSDLEDLTIMAPGSWNRKKNPWLLGEMLESGFPDAGGREEG